MSTVPSKYQPSPRLIDDRQRLHALYVEKDFSIREIAADSEFSKTAIGDALKEYGITNNERTSERGWDPPTIEDDGVTWSRLQTE